jgi:ABC-2 type transport system permease protein
MRHVTLAVLRRNLTHALKNPALLLPSLLFPLLFFTAFAGGLSAVGDVPAFDFAPGYTAFQYVFVFLQSAAFGGVFTGFAIAADFESGFARRLMLGAPHRTGLLAGYALAALCRWLLTATVVTVVALLSGMDVLGEPSQLAALLVLAVLVNAAALLWAAGVAMRFQTLQAGPAMQIPVFLVLFLSPVYVPVELLSGWIQAVAEVNPISLVLSAARGLLAADPDGTAVAFGVALALVAAFGTWALRGLRLAERGRVRGG